jgi:hypothetical protein
MLSMKSNQVLRGSLASCAIVLASVFAGSLAQAAGPTVSECLDASSASLKAGNEHKLRAERAALLRCASASCPSEVRKECSRRVDEVNAAMPTLVFEAKDENGNDLSAVKVLLDGQPFASRLDGSALPVDPGEHTFLLETDGYPALSKKLVIRESEKDRRESIRFGNAPTEPAAAAGAKESNKAPEPASAPGEERQGMPGQKIAALTVGAVGVVALGVGGAFGLSALSKKSSAQQVCPDQCADTNGQDAWHRAKSAGNLSTIFFVAGGVGVAAAATLWFTAPHASETQVGFGLGNLQLRGSF